jgi:serine/threonine-protein kinase HipA
VSRRLEVLLYGTPVGEVSEAADGRTEFRFLESYYEMVPRPVLGQKFEDDLRRVHRSRHHGELPDFFANLTPEGRLRELIEQTTEVETSDDLALLAYVGRDLPGAVEVRPYEGEGLVSAGTPPAERRSTGEPDEETSEGLRFSLAGVQLKLSMLRKGEKLTAPVQEQAGDWIAKFDSPSFPHLPENEYSILEWARTAGFDVPKCHLHAVGDLDPDSELLGVVRRIVAEGTKVLAIRRYDRGSAGRVHQEDFAQVVGLPPALKYEHIRHEDMAILVQQLIGEEAIEEYVRRLVLAIATGNGDAHLKNWSLVYPDRIRPAWSPLYDQVATVAWRAPARELALKLGGVKAFVRIDRRTFDRFAERAGIDRSCLASWIDETLDRLQQAWRKCHRELPLEPSHRKAIENHWQQVPLLKASGGLD